MSLGTRQIVCDSLPFNFSFFRKYTFAKKCYTLNRKRNDKIEINRFFFTTETLTKRIKLHISNFKFFKFISFKLFIKFSSSFFPCHRKLICQKSEFMKI